MKTNMDFGAFLPTRVLFGAGRLKDLHRQTMPGRKALLIISNGKSARENGYFARTEEQLKNAGVTHAVFDGVEANPLKSTVMAGAAVAKDNGCDFIVALGGGSVMDAAKAIAIVATNGGDLWDYVRGGTGAGKVVSNKPLPVVAITTTAGTGSEVDPWGVITNAETHEKIGIGVEGTLPVLAVVDPELMLTVPPLYTAFQGFDALFHSVEGYIGNKANLMSDVYALAAMENIGKNLAKAVKDGGDLEARTKVAFGNTLSGLVMCVSSTTSQHSLEHAMSAFHQNLPHGAGLIMLSRAYFNHFIEKGVANERFLQMARALGMENAIRPADFITALAKLQEDCAVANLEMSSYGITPGEFRSLAVNAKETMGGLFLADRSELSIEDCVAIYEASYGHSR
jgi:alcohol dehydrogenase